MSASRKENAEPEDRGARERKMVTSRLRSGHLRADLTDTWLTEAERLTLSKYREDLGGDILELGVGGGRLTGRLLDTARSLFGIDIAPDMVAYCRSTFPTATFAEEDFRNLSTWNADSWDVVYSGWNSFDVLAMSERETLIADIARLLRPNGLLIFSTHNLGSLALVRRPWNGAPAGLRPLARWLARRPRALRNYWRLARLQHVGTDHAIVVDDALDHSLLQIYISRDGQERQLAAHGFVLHDCLDENAKTVAPGGSAYGSTTLYYAARRS
jgi:SAM-dependent methyltransferase